MYEHNIELSSTAAIQHQKATSDIMCHILAEMNCKDLKNTMEDYVKNIDVVLSYLDEKFSRLLCKDKERLEEYAGIMKYVIIAVKELKEGVLENDETLLRLVIPKLKSSF